MIKALRTRAAPWFVIAVVLLVLGFVLPGDTLQSVVRSVAVLLLLAACIRLLGLLVRDNDVGAEMVTKRSIEAGVAGWMADDSAKRRERKAAAKRADDDG